MLFDPPPVPASQAVAVRNTRDPSLLWVHAGTAEVRTAQQQYPLSSGQGIWLPAGIPYTVEVGADSVAFPIFPAAGTRAPTLDRPQRIDLPSSWSEWLIYQFARSIGYLRGATSDTSLLDLVAGSRYATPKEEARPIEQVPVPPMPRSPEAVTVAHSLLQRPDDPSETTDHARAVNISVRTLQLQFLQETGLPFVRWRTAVRVAASAALMDAGHEIGQAGRQVGFSTPAGFTRAFHTQTGMTPRQYKKARPAIARRDGNFAGTPSELMLQQLQPQEAPNEASPPLIPATQTWNRINDFHVLVWLYRGAARVTVGERTRRLRRGDAIWLPAGVRNSITLSRGALLLPLGSRHGTPETRLPRNLVQRFPDEAELYLLHTFVANYSLVRPRSHDPNGITHSFLKHATRTRARAAEDPAGTTPVYKIIRAVRNDPADRRTLTQWAQALNADARDLGRAFLATTGQNYVAWRSEVRMTEARRYLEEGLGVAQVSRKLGYAHPSTFTTVFTRAHDMSPREYQRHGWQHTDESLIIR